MEKNWQNSDAGEGGTRVLVKKFEDQSSQLKSFSHLNDFRWLFPYLVRTWFGLNIFFMTKAVFPSFKAKFQRIPGRSFNLSFFWAILSHLIPNQTIPYCNPGKIRPAAIFSFSTIKSPKAIFCNQLIDKCPINRFTFLRKEKNVVHFLRPGWFLLGEFKTGA